MMSASRVALPARLGWPHWLGALLFGLMLSLLVLIASWLLRACAPVDPVLNVATLESNEPPSAPSAPDISPALRASLDQTMAVGKTLVAELARLQAEIKMKVASCKPTAPPEPQSLPAERWGKKDLTVLKGCWQLSHEGTTRLSRQVIPGVIPPRDQGEKCEVRADRICLGENGVGRRDRTIVCPSAGTVPCSTSIAATFGADGTLRTTQGDAMCGAVMHWVAEWNALTCRRVNDDYAACRSASGFDYDFRRPP